MRGESMEAWLEACSLLPDHLKSRIQAEADCRPVLRHWAAAECPPCLKECRRVHATFDDLLNASSSSPSSAASLASSQSTSAFSASSSSSASSTSPPPSPCPSPSSSVAAASSFSFDSLKDLLQAGKNGFPQCFIIVEKVFDDAGVSAAAAKEAQALHSAGLFKAAGFNTKEGHRTVDAESRGDTILWLHAKELDASPSLRRAASVFGELLLRLNETLRRLEQNVQLEANELQLAVYPKDSTGYVAHKDRGASAGRDRYVTAILFLNELWQPAWGGDLRLHLRDCLLDICPVANRMIIFRSDLLEHSVLPIKENSRFALTCWFSVRRSSS